MIKALVATKSDVRAVDFCNVPEDELVCWTGFEVADEHNECTPNGHCVCKRSLAGIESSLEVEDELGIRTTTFRVAELEMTEREYIELIGDFFSEMGWETGDAEDKESDREMRRLAKHDAKELLKIANYFDVDDIIGKEGDDFFLLIGANEQTGDYDLASMKVAVNQVM